MPVNDDAAALAAAAQAQAEAEAELKAKQEAEARAKAVAAEAKAKQEAERKEAERQEAERRAKAQAEAKAKLEAQAKAKREAEEKAQREAEAKAKAEAEAKAKAKAEAEKKAAAEAERKARERAEAERKAREKAEAERKAKAKAEADAKAKREAEAKAKKEAEARAKAEAEKKAKEEAKARDLARKKAEAEAKKKALAEQKAKERAEAKAAKEAKEAEARAAAEAAEKAANLGDTFRRLIRETGPISLAHYMAESNARYYTSRDPLGEEGDFITAPEVSQMFGELIGLWFADLWVKMGARKHIHFVELGPGRGTLSKDALRVAARYDFAPKLHMVETSPALRKLQREAFPDVIHHDDLSTLPDDAPLLIVGNEFFDALPVHQLIRSANGWHERMVGLGENDEFIFVAGDKPMDAIVPKSWKSASQGTMIETSAAASALMQEVATRLKNQGGAALFIDYGPFELRSGSTLQALKDHKKVDVFAHPGQADLTAHVDFEMLSQVAKANGADVMGVEMQGDWLRAMGIDVRLEALQMKNPNDAAKLKRQYDRLVDDAQMGTLFKVMGLCGRRWPDGVGFS